VSRPGQEQPRTGIARTAIAGTGIRPARVRGAQYSSLQGCAWRQQAAPWLVEREGACGE
jgi:hypothetical protein